jgi:6-phosphogluconate dehydrogenase
MKIGLVGLGKMGYQLALNMRDNQFEVVAHDTSKEVMKEISEQGIITVNSYKEMLEQLPKPRVIWLMVPAGNILENVLHQFKDLLDKEDILIDGGNSNYLDSIQHYNLLKEKEIHFIDCGTSGGTTGARNGACLMVGGEQKVVQGIEELFTSIAAPNGYGYMGNPGSGHYVKMVHNGIEYGMMQAIGEGFDLMNNSKFDLNYETITRVWSNGSIIESALLDNVNAAVSKDPKLDQIDGRVDDSGEGQWMIEDALRNKVSIPAITSALFARYKSKDDVKFSEKVVAAMRNEFGGHKVYKK